MHSVFAQNVRYAGVDDWDDWNRCLLLMFTGVCPHCGKIIHADTQCSGSHCECEGVTWRLNLSVTTADLPGCRWSRSQIRTRGLQLIAETAASRNKMSKAAREILAKLTKEFGRKSVAEAVAAGPLLLETEGLDPGRQSP